MKVKILTLLFLFTAVLASASIVSSTQGGNDPWSSQQLLSPSDLAKTIGSPKATQPVIFSVGMEPIIKGSVDIGPTMMSENLDKLKQRLAKMPKNTGIVVYCGCCPFANCPNIRPAMQLLREMKFTNYKLLNIPQNIKVDWIDKGYPMSE